MKPEDVKIGMRVRMVRPDSGDIAVGILHGAEGGVVDPTEPIGVQWDGLSLGHTCQGKAVRGTGRWVRSHQVEPIPTAPEKPVRKIRSYQPPKTSLDALKRLRKASDDTVWRVLRCIGKRGRTCDEVEAILGTSHQSTSARIRDLVKAGRLQDTGKRRNTRTGNKATVWRETEW